MRYSRVESNVTTTISGALAGTSAGAPGVVIPVADIPAILAVPGVEFIDTAGAFITLGTAASPLALYMDTLDILSSRSRFEGVGPRLGVDAAYNFCGNFGVVAFFSTSLLVGRVHNSFNETASADFASNLTVATIVPTEIFDLGFGVVSAVALSVSATEPLNISYAEENRVIPNIDAKLGLDWTYQFCNCTHTKMIVEAGYKISHYFNAENNNINLNAVNSTLSAQTFDISFDGPYLGIQVAI